MNNQHLDQLISNFNIENLDRFMRDRSLKYTPKKENLLVYEDDLFKKGLKTGEIDFGDNEKLVVCTFECDFSLSERSGKKAQYEKAKKILKELMFDAGIFVYYDKVGDFRFSLIYTNYLGKTRDWSLYRRFTYFVSQEFTNKTFITQIGVVENNFSSISAIKEAFSVEKVTKEFYRDIAYWYEWANLIVKFPADAETDINGRKMAVIRMITRIIFIWFMKIKGLIRNSLFDEEEIKKMLIGLDTEESTYYQAVLQNLFFATLSTKREDRIFRREVRGNQGYDPDYGNKSVFRYQELFIHSEKIQEYFGDIPFLNGGLFDCLDDPEHGLIIDGFTDVKKNQAFVPNKLFFGKENQIDLNQEYRTKSAKYTVRGLFETFSMYNFTIDENTVDDQDVALDPELLGRVFENLLAEFNPETETTARKATGSYYTPREIVDYMVSESLKNYFKIHLEDIEEIDDKLTNLFSENYQDDTFTPEQKTRIVDLVENLRLVDPAVGSGAYPMGVLNQLVSILHKVDKSNALWEKEQLDAAESIPDSTLREDTKRRISSYFRDKNPDYGRKLYLIQKCIYGVDIQPIAIEIAKLRFFLSLLVDENNDIVPLPNLDFKIMQGDSLVSEFLGIDFDAWDLGETSAKPQQLKGIDPIDALIEEFKNKKNKYQSESDQGKKKKLWNDVEDAMIQIFEVQMKIQEADHLSG